VALKPGITLSTDIEDKVIAAIDREIGKIARPSNVWIVPDMPKTRSGKIMRRLLRDIAEGRELGDVTTLRDPAVMKELEAKVGAEGGE